MYYQDYKQDDGLELSVSILYIYIYIYDGLHLDIK